MRRRNPVKNTVKHFIGASRKRKLHRRHKSRLTNPKSRFVLFLESIENDTSRHTYPLYTKWVTKVHRAMEKNGTWPNDLSACEIEVVAEYVSRLQMAFWDEFPRDCWYRFPNKYNLYAEKYRTARSVFEKIYKKIRRWGLYTRTYELMNWRKVDNLLRTEIDSGPHYWANTKMCIEIFPYTPYNDHGGGI